ncbi:MAG: 16S rRNA processing protein RimM [Thermoleophilia bacterium]|nr:16S rRNA processing protein RimM [Thermoleophilia bacterium]
MARPEWIEVGRIVRAHGVHGEVRVIPDSDNPERFAPGSILHARPRRLGVAGPRLREQVRLTVEGVRGDADFPIVGFREVTDRDRAEAMRGYVLEVRSTQLPELPEDEFYPFDLEALRVRDPGGAAVGKVTAVVESPAHPILVIELDTGGERMVPFVSAAVPTVALAEGYLVVEPRFLDESDRRDAGEDTQR